jgi:hypothetical protein
MRSGISFEAPLKPDLLREHFAVLVVIPGISSGAPLKHLVDRERPKVRA